jgi:galactokinase
MHILTAEEQWQAFANKILTEETGFFDGISEITGARAPGRLDVLGGIADYSGSMVLEGTLAEGTVSAVQGRADRLLKIKSLCLDTARNSEVLQSLDLFLEDGSLRSFEDAKAALRDSSGARWSAYISGCLYVLMASGWLEVERATGLNILVDSSVPIGAGVSSSAALEVAVMNALCGHFEVQMDGQEIARLCQIVENRIVGAPCGIMDQMTCSLGQENSLLVLKCQPAEVVANYALPNGWNIIALDSGVKHSVGGRYYGRARTAAFMGLKIAQGKITENLNGYLCRLTPEAWNEIKGDVPKTLAGEEFLSTFGDLPDTVSSIIPDEIYPVRSCAEHPILENARVQKFIGLMQAAATNPNEELLEQAGALMLEAHESYTSRVALGCAETDLLVNLVMERGKAHGLYGAKITGGGAGGSVAILCSGEQTLEAVREVQREYEKRTGLHARIMTGSSPGAVQFGTRRITYTADDR